MKTTQKISSVSFLNRSLIKLSLIVFAITFVFSFTGFNTEIGNESNSLLIPGVVYEIEVTDHEQSPPKTESIQAAVEGSHLKMGIASSGKSKGEMIFRGDRGENGEVIIVDHDNKSFSVMDDAFIDGMIARVDQSKNMMQEAMKSLSKEQRDMIAKMQKEKGAKIPGFEMAALPQMKLVNTGQRGTKVGYPCVKYEVFLDGKKIREMWTTDWSNLEGGDEAEGVFSAMNDFFKKIKDKMGDFPGGSDFYDEMNFGNGFPVVTKGFDDYTGDLEEETTLRSARRRTLDPDAFEPPSGYKRQEMFGGN